MPSVMFTIPLGFTVPVAFLMVNLAVFGVKPLLVSSPDEPLTYIISPSAAETVPDKIMAKSSAMNISRKFCFFMFSPPFTIFIYKFDSYFTLLCTKFKL
nr:hypothetical protein [uncultured Methanobacterium sp.]